jgi:hypothetical protein
MTIRREPRDRSDRRTMLSLAMLLAATASGGQTKEDVLGSWEAQYRELAGGRPVHAIVHVRASRRAHALPRLSREEAEHPVAEEAAHGTETSPGLAKILLKKHHRAALAMKDINRITLWVDANSNELGAYYDEDKQRAGEVVRPLIDMDPANPAGLDLFAPGVRPPTPNASTPLMKKSEELIKRLWPRRK